MGFDTFLRYVVQLSSHRIDPSVHQSLRQSRGSTLRHATATSFLIISNIAYTALLASESKNEICVV